MENNNILVLANGHEFQFAAGSRVTDLIGVYEAFSEVDAVRVDLTAENLIGATFNGEVIENVVPDRINASVSDNGLVTAHFINRAKTTEEIMQEQITELQEAVAEIAG